MFWKQLFMGRTMNYQDEFLAPFLSEAVEASRCYFFANWLMKLKCPILLKPLDTMIQENYWSFYPSEPFSLDLLNMIHPVSSNHHCSLNSMHDLITTACLPWYPKTKRLIRNANFVFICKYRIVASTSPSRIEAHAGLFRSLMKGIFDPYVLWPFDKKLIF